MVRKVGRGKYSEVFEGVNVHTRQRCIIKILKVVFLLVCLFPFLSLGSIAIIKSQD